jgi:hypothetical protein
MATYRPFAYNTGTTISATTQIGDLAIGTNDLPLSEGYGGLSWKNGPDEDLGYVIGYPQSGGTQPLPISGTGFVQFWRSNIPGDDTSFINLAEYISRKYSTPQTFATADDAKIWLNSNGFWTSYDSPVTPTPTETSIIPTPTPTETSIIPTPTPTPTATDLSSVTTYAISGCTNLNTLVVDLGPGFIVPGDVFYFSFSGATPEGCYSVVGKINAPIEDAYLSSFGYGNCNDCEVAQVTPTPTETSIIPTPTPTETSIIPTPTPTATPSVTPEPVTGYSFNLIQLPYNFPTTGNTIMNATAPTQTGSTNPNELTLNQRGIYFNSIDSDGVDRTSYFSQFTGQSITITMTQTGSTAIYSGDTQAFKYWSGNTGASPFVPGDGFVFGTNIQLAGMTAGTGNAVIIQSASTNWVSGQTVYISLVVNGAAVTPTPTATNLPLTPTPTETSIIPTPTPTETSIIPTPTITPTPTTPFTLKVESANSGVTITDLISGGTFTYNLTSGSFPITNSAVYGTHSATGTLNPTDVLLNFNATNSSTFTITKNGVELVNFPASAGSGQQYILGSQFSNILSTDVMILKFQ